MKDADANSAPMLCSSNWSRADDKLADSIRTFWDELDETDRTLFVFVVVVAAFIWYGLILGMAWED